MSFRRGLALRPVQSEKHEITWSNLAQNASTVQTIQIAEGLNASVASAANQVPTGATVKAIYFEFHFSAQVTTNPKVIHWQIGKEPFETDLSIPSTYFNSDKRFIFKRGMEMLPSDQSTVFKRIFVVRIPPKFRRIGQNDKLVFSYIASSTETINACGIAIYKAFI